MLRFFRAKKGAVTAPGNKSLRSSQPLQHGKCNQRTNTDLPRETLLRVPDTSFAVGGAQLPLT